MIENANLILIAAEDDNFRSEASIAFQKKGWIVLTSLMGKQATVNIVKYQPSVVLMDIVLPDLSGIDVCRSIKNNPKMTDQFPIILMGTSPDKALIADAIDARCDDFIIKPLTFFVLFSKIEKLVNFYHNKIIKLTEERESLEEVESDEETDIIKYARPVIERAFSNSMHDKPIIYPAVKKTISKMMAELYEKKKVSLAFKLKSYHDYTYVHSINVAALSLTLAYHLKWDHPSLKKIGEGALLHDIGKSKIDLQVLLKPDTLSDEEFVEIKKHAQYSGDIMTNERFNEDIIKIGMQHHERMDGSGYPQKLVSDQINKYARVVAIVDVYDALTTDRCYGKAVESVDAVKTISEISGQFDPEIFKKFYDLVTSGVIGK